MGTAPRFNRAPGVTRKRAMIMTITLGLISLPVALAFTGAGGQPVAQLVVALAYALSVPGLWLATYGIRLDHENAHKGVWWSIWVHSLGFSGSMIVVLLAAAVMAAPEVLFFAFTLPIFPLLAAIAPLIASSVKGSFRVDPPVALPSSVAEHPADPGVAPTVLAQPVTAPQASRDDA